MSNDTKLQTNEVDIQILKVVVSKLDETLDKITESTNAIGKLLAVHADKIHNLEKDQDGINQELKAMYNRIETTTKEILEKMDGLESDIDNHIDEVSKQNAIQYQDLSNKVDKLDNRLVELEKFRWYVAGGVALILFLISEGLIPLPHK